MKEGWKRGLALVGLMLVYGAEKIWPEHQGIYDLLIPFFLAMGGVGLLHAKLAGGK